MSPGPEEDYGARMSRCRSKSRAKRYSVVEHGETGEESTMWQMYRATNTAREEEIALRPELKVEVGLRIAVHDVRMILPEIEA